MPYIGNSHIAGDHTNNFKVLDDISSFTATFDGSATSVVDTTNNTIRVVEHRFIQGQRVTYTNGGGGNIGSLTTGTAYFVIFDSASTIKLATSASNAASSTAINLSAVGTGSSHTLNAAFDGVNKKFKLSHSSGTDARLNNASQVNIAINNVVQRPNLDPNNFTDGFALEDNHKIVFQTAPSVNDIFWGTIIANTLTTFDISDHKIDTFTGDGSTTEFNLSHTPANNESLMVTINGVLQHPSNASTARAYTLIANVIQFTAAPGVGDEIQVRHMGFAGATTADVSGFYGRTGNVALTANDHIITGDITARNINASGILTASSASFSGNVSIGGTLTYEDVTNIDSVGIITARDGIDCNGDLDVDGHTNLDNVSIAGVTTFNNATITGILNAGSSIRINTTDDQALRLNATDNGPIYMRFDRSGARKAWFGYGSATDSLTLRNEISDGDLYLSVTDGGITKNAIHIDSSENAKVNILQDFDVDGHTNLDHVSIAGVTTFANGYVDLKPGNGGDAHFRILSTGSGDAGIFFDAANGDIVGSDYVFIGQKNNLDFVINPNANAGNIDFQRGGTTQVRITSAGTLKFTGQNTSLETAGITHHTNNNLYIRGGTTGLVLSNHDSTNTIHISNSDFIKFETTDGTEKFKINSIGQLTSTASNNGQIIHYFKNTDTTVSSSAMTVEQHFNFNRTGGGLNLSAARIIAGKEREWVGAASNQDGYFAIHTTKNETSTERLRINSSGNVGIGTNIVDSSANLSITDTGSARIYMKSGNSSDTSIYFGRLNDSATAAIRYEHSEESLDFYGFNNSKRLRIGNDGTVSKYHNSLVQAAFGGTGQINGITATPSMAGVPFVVGRDTGSLRSAHFAGHLKFDSGYGIQGTEFSVYGNTSGLYLNSNVSGDSIIFQTHNGSSIGERLRITSEGYVRIGGTIGNFPLNVIDESNRTTTAVPTIGLYAKHDGSGNTGVGFGGGINFWGDRNGDNARQTMGRIFCVADVNSGTNISGALTFETSTAGTPTEKLRITSGGNIGIGIDNPQSILHIEHSTPGIRLSDTGNSSAYAFFDANAANAIIHADKGNTVSDSRVAFAVDNSEKMRIDSYGVLRVGNTHTQNTSSNTKRIALGAKGSIWGWATGQINGALNLADNYYWDGVNNKAIESDHCAYLTLRSGSLRFGTTNSSQTGGQNISGGINERFRIDSSGQMGIGLVSPGAPLHVYHATTNTIAQFQSGDAGAGILLKDNTHYTRLESTNGTFKIDVDAGGQIGSEAISLQISNSEKLRIDSNANLKQGTSTPAAFTSTAPNNTQRFLTPKCMQGCVTDTTTLDNSGNGTFDLGKLWITDDTSIEMFIQVVRNDTGNYTTHYAKAFINKVRGTGMSQGHILYQNGAASGFSLSAPTSGGYASPTPSHGTQISCSGGAGGVIYRLTCFYTAISKNDMY